ncbi:cilia- and flagella-associated protein 97-like [Dermacentor albipictus]|uniref:cilia- and flagella-associated protein 97-like n=1 Tax=Dermacentor albipictus TaxID=60249 RepID=UPI0038FBE477
MSWKADLAGDDEDLQSDIAFFDSEAASTSQPCYIKGNGVENKPPCSAAAVDLGSLGQNIRDAVSFTAQGALSSSSSSIGGNSGLLPFESSYRLPSSSFFARRVSPPVAPQNVSLTDRDMKEPSPPLLRNSCMEQDDGNEDVDGQDAASSPRSSVTDSEGLSSLSEGSMEDLSESESITDVTPLHSPYMCDSPVPVMKLPVSKLTMSEAGINGVSRSGDSSSGSDSDRSSFSGARRKRSSAGPLPGKVRLGSKHQQREPVDLQLLVDAIRRLEAHQCEQGQANRAREEPRAKGRKNMSFSNEEVQRIDRENQRLLKRILAQQNRPRPKFDSRTPSRLAPSAINRQRQQRQIEVENLALLKRIESAKPSREVAPSQDLSHVQRARSHSLSLTRHTLQTPPVMATAATPPLAGVKHFPPRQKHHSH